MHQHLQPMATVILGVACQMGKDGIARDYLAGRSRERAYYQTLGLGQLHLRATGRNQIPSRRAESPTRWAFVCDSGNAQWFQAPQQALQRGYQRGNVDRPGNTGVGAIVRCACLPTLPGAVFGEYHDSRIGDGSKPISQGQAVGIRQVAVQDEQ